MSVRFDLAVAQTFTDASALFFSQGQFDGQASFVSSIQVFFFFFFLTKLHPVTAIESLLTFIAEYDLLLFLIFLPLVFFLNILSLCLIPHVFQYTSLSPLTPPHWCCLGCGHRQPKGEHKVQSECWSVWLGRRGQTQHAPRHQHRFTWWELAGIYWKADDVFL